METLKVWKWLLEQNFEEKNYTTLISIKSTKNFVSTTFLNDHFYLTVLLIAVNFNFSNAPSAQDNLAKLLNALSTLNRF